MATLPTEQVLQRQHVNIVSGPGVVLWGSTTDDWDMATWTADADVIDEVEDQTDSIYGEFTYGHGRYEVGESEVEIAHMAPPEFFWDVEADLWPHFPIDVYGLEEYGLQNYGEPYIERGDDRPGIYQDLEFGEFEFGDGGFGGVETVWNVEYPKYGYTMTGDE